MTRAKANNTYIIRVLRIKIVEFLVSKFQYGTIIYGIVTDIFWMHNYSLHVIRYSFEFAQNIRFKVGTSTSTVRVSSKVVMIGS